MQIFAVQHLSQSRPATRMLLLSATVCLFSACSVLTPKTAESVNTLSETHQFEKALKLYQQIPEPEQKKVDLKALRQQQKHDLQQLLKEAKKLQGAYSFYQAEDILIQGQDNLHSSQVIKKAIADLALAKGQYTDQYQQQYDEEYARFLLAEQPLLDRLLNSQGQERSFKKHYKSQQQAREKHSDIIGRHGLQALNSGFIQTAARQLDMAQRLQGDERWESALSSIKSKTYKADSHKKRMLKKQKNMNQKQKAIELAQQREHINKLKQKFNLQLGDVSIIDAGTTLKEIKRLDYNSNEAGWIKTSHAKLAEVTEAQLAADLRQGKVYYSKGMIDEAIKTWKKAQSYAPNNSELNEHIRRAETFQARYKELNKH